MFQEIVKIGFSMSDFFCIFLNSEYLKICSYVDFQLRNVVFKLTFVTFGTFPESLFWNYLKQDG